MQRENSLASGSQKEQSSFSEWNCDISILSHQRGSPQTAPILGSLAQAEKAERVGLGYSWTRLYALGVIPTMRLNVLMKALTLL